MKKEDNVCGNEAPETGRAAEAEKEKGSAVLGKFRSVDALAEAYGALEAEFTRRSQRLKALEKQADNFRAAPSDAFSETAEKPQKKEAVKEEKPLRASDGEEKFSKTPSAGCGEEKESSESPSVSCTEAAAKPCPSEEGGKPALSQTPPEEEREAFRDKANGENPEGKASEEELYLAASRSEAVRLRIIGDYLASLRSADAPLMRGGTAAFAAPPVKAKSIADAGNMALRYFKKDK